MKDEFIEYKFVLEIQSSGDLIFLKSILDAEGITYYVQGEHVVQFIYHSVPMRLMVKKEDVAKVREIIKDMKLSPAYSGLKRFKDDNEEER